MSKLFIEVEGFPQLIQNIKLLSDDKVKRAEMLKVLRQVANPTLNVARSKVPVQRSYSNIKSKRSVVGGSLRQSLGIITGKGPNPTVYVGPRVFKGKKAATSGRNTFGNGWYGAIVDQGHKIYNNQSLKGTVTKKGRKRITNERITRKRTGVSSGVVAGSFFMKRSYDITQGQVTTDAEKKFAAYIQKQIDRLSK